jgi:hypothetical protein
VICRASQAAVGWQVTSNHRSRRRPWPRTRKTNNRSKLSVGTMHISTRQSPQRDCEEMSSSFATAAYRLGPYILRPSTGRPHSRASTARHGSATHPTACFPCSCAGSIREARDRSLAALPYSAISTARRGNHAAAQAVSTRSDRNSSRHASPKSPRMSMAFLLNKMKPANTSHTCAAAPPAVSSGATRISMPRVMPQERHRFPPLCRG